LVRAAERADLTRGDLLQPDQDLLPVVLHAQLLQDVQREEKPHLVLPVHHRPPRRPVPCSEPLPSLSIWRAAARSLRWKRSEGFPTAPPGCFEQSASQPGSSSCATTL